MDPSRYLDADWNSMSDNTSGPKRYRASSFIQVGLAALLGALSLLVGAVAQLDIPLPWQHNIGAPETTIVLPASATERAPALRLAVLGDVGTGGPEEWATAGLAAEAASERQFDGLVLLGDNVYPNGDPSRLDATVFDPFAPILDQGTTLLPVLGNHDVQDGHAAGQVAAFGLPGRWYAVDLGAVLFIGLDSNLVGDGSQAAWLEATLREAGHEWIIVAMHHPPYSAGIHGSDRSVRREWVPLFEQYGVDLVLAGHDHDYQRSEIINGVTYVVSGGGAGTRLTGAADFTAYSASVLHYVDVKVGDGWMEVVAHSAAGPFDYVVIEGPGL